MRAVPHGARGSWSGVASIAIASLAWSGCATPATDRPAIERRDSAGIELVINAAPAWAEHEAWRVDSGSAIELLAPGVELFRLRGVVEVDGRIVVANSGTHQLLFFDTTGAFLFARGRQGSGPADFGLIGWIQSCGAGTFVVHDRRNLRLVWWNARGEPERSWRRPLSIGNTSLQPLGLYADCSTMQRARLRGFSDPGDGYFRDTVALVRLGLDSTSLPDTVLRYLGSARYQHNQGDLLTVFAVPFAPESFVFAIGQETLHGEGSRFEYEVVRPDGSRRRIVRRADHEPILVPAESIAAYKSRQLEDEPDRLRGPVAASLDRLPYPSHFAAWDTARVDSRGNLWIRERPVGTPARWAVFDSSGRWLGHVRLPARWGLDHIGERRLVARHLDDDDVEHLLLVPIDKLQRSP